MNPWLLTILILLAIEFILDTTADWLDLRHFSDTLPDEFKDVYEDSRYRKSQHYQRDWTRFGVTRRIVTLAFTLGFLLLGGFNQVDLLARSLTNQPLALALIFAALLSVLRLLLGLPFSVYATFVIEERYGFNKTSPRTFSLDLLKGLVLGAILGAPIFGGIVWFFEKVGPLAWLDSWLFLTAIQLVLVYLAPAFILPLFNKFEPLPQGELRDAIEKYMASRHFTLQGIYTMDGSRRSTKANAYFTGFGKLRRLVLFDTLITKHTCEELVAVLAHEVGHFQKKHIPKSMALSILTTGLIFYTFSFFVGNPGLAAAFRMDHVSIYSSLIFIGFLYSPVMRLFSILTQAISRRFEFEADAFASGTYGKPEALISALKKLSADNLSHLTPHPLKVLLDYSHPPVLERIRALRSRRVHPTGQSLRG